MALQYRFVGINRDASPNTNPYILQREIEFTCVLYVVEYYTFVNYSFGL